MNKPEQALQRAILTLLWRQYPAGFVFHVPNGGKRGRIEAYNLKLNGVKAGVPDLCVIRPGGRVGWIEVKAGTGVSEAQEKLHAEWRLKGHEVHVVESLDALGVIIEQWKKEDES